MSTDLEAHQKRVAQEQQIVHAIGRVEDDINRNKREAKILKDNLADLQKQLFALAGSDVQHELDFGAEADD